jgi:C-terminal processing protease CtpA/Prc
MMGLMGILPVQAETLHAQVSQEVNKPQSHGIVGLNLEIRAATLPRIMGVFPGTPAARANLQLGDQIVAVNGRSLLGLSSHAVDMAISDIPGDKVNFLIARNGRIFPITLIVQDLDSVPSRQIQNLYQGLF